MNNPSPLALVCITLMMEGLLDFEGVPSIVADEVRYFYPLLTGKPIEDTPEEV